MSSISRRRSGGLDMTRLFLLLALLMLPRLALA
jgi:hypothetical protein